MRVFLDTNVWIDFLLAREPHYMAAVTLLTLADKGELEIAVSTSTILTSNYVCCERAKMPQRLWCNKIRGTRELIKVYDADASLIYEALDLGWSDYEDAVQNLIAKKSACSYIVTRNPNDFVLSEIPVCSPDDLVTKIKR